MLQQPPPESAAPSQNETLVPPPSVEANAVEERARDGMDQAPGYTPTVRAGDRLKNARSMAALTLEQASERLRIRKDYLAALEDMNVKLLPGKAYAIPYLRSYARLLGLDADALITQFQAESALSREDATPQIRNPDSKPARERPWIWALALVAVAGGFVAYRALFSSQTPGDTQTASQRPPAAASAQAAGDARIVAPSVEGDGLPFGIAAQKVEIRAIAQAWLEVRTPGGTVMLSQDLAPGQVYQPEAGAGWTLHARDGGAFEVFLNGAMVGVLGQPGAPVLGRQVDGIAATAVVANANGAQGQAGQQPGATPMPGPSVLAQPAAPALTPAPRLPSAVSPTLSSAAAPAPARVPRPKPRPAEPRPAPIAKAAPSESGQPSAPAAPSGPIESWEVGETPRSPGT